MKQYLNAIFGITALPALFGGATCTARADDDFSKEVVKATKLTDTLFFLEGAGGNMTASIGPDGTFLVDDDFAEMAGKLLAKLKELKGGSPRFVVNTHFHYDHTGGNEIFGSTATIIAAGGVRSRLATEQTLWKKRHPAVPERALPQLTFETSLRLHFNGDEIRVVHFPHGHTDGDTVVFFEKGKVASLGDLYFSGMYPIVHPEHQGGLLDTVGDLETVLQQIPDDAKVVPGHGPVTDKAGLERYLQMIRASVGVVRDGIRRGLRLEQIQKAGLPAEWEPFSHGYRTTDQWLASVYEAVSKETSTQPRSAGSVRSDRSSGSCS